MNFKRPKLHTVLAACGTAGLALAWPAAHAQEYARVLASVPVIQQISVPRQVCSTQQVMVEQPRSGASALLGAVAGGAAGNAIGDGSGRAAATALGLIGGAFLGNKIEGSPGARMQEQTTCSTQTVQENRTVGYSVTYEYAGRQYQVQMPQDPGPTLRVQVTPVMPPQSQQPYLPSPSGRQYPMHSPDQGYSSRPMTVQRVAIVRPSATYHGHWETHGAYVNPGQAHRPHLHPHRHWR